jgi:hypothetical protein
MADEKKVLTPEEITIEIRNKLIWLLPVGYLNEDLFKETLSGMIREYGEQQRKKVSHEPDCTHENYEHERLRCNVCQDCGWILEVNI